MKYTPIIFSTEMVPKVLDGSKTQTRRTYGLDEINKCPDEWRLIGNLHSYFIFEHATLGIRSVKCPYGQAGDRLWGKETWRLDRWVSPNELSAYFRIFIGYKGDTVHQYDFDGWPEGFDKSHRLRNGEGEWVSSLYMPRWASRITQELTADPIPQRLQEITEEDAIAEGFGSSSDAKLYCMGFHRYWDSKNAKRGYGWEFNPWVWPISFAKLM